MRAVTSRLKVRRMECGGISQMDLAIDAELPWKRYWEIEHGYRQPSEAEANRIARALKTTRHELFAELFPAQVSA